VPLASGEYALDKFSPLHQRIAHCILAVQNQEIEDEKVQGRARRATVLQRIEGWPAVFVQRHNLPSMTVSSGSCASAVTMTGYRALKSWSLRDRGVRYPRFLSPIHGSQTSLSS